MRFEKYTLEIEIRKMLVIVFRKYIKSRGPADALSRSRALLFSPLYYKGLNSSALDKL